MPDRLDKALLILGIVSYLAGQTWINITLSMTKDQIAIDVIHWLMLIGAALMIPYAARLPRRGLAVLVSPIWLIGIIQIIGMCVIDFVFWAIPDPELSRRVADELTQTDPLWGPFIRHAGTLFTVGLVLAGLRYWPTSRIGAGLVAIGGLVIMAWGIGSNPYGYSVLLAGFLTCFWVEAKASNEA